MVAKLKPENHAIVETLEGLVDRLGSPDLTAAESHDLRPRLLGLLESIERETVTPAHNPPYLNAHMGDLKPARVSRRCLVV